MLPVRNTAIPRAQTQVGDQTDNISLLFLWLFFICFCIFCVLDSVAKVAPRIPSASLSQSVAVEETVLPAASQNITAYAVNTEMSQRYAKHQQTPPCTHHLPRSSSPDVFHVTFLRVFRRQVREVAGVTSVGETPEKKQNQDTSQRRGSSLVPQKTATQCVVAETMSSSFTAVANTESQKKKKPDSKVAGSFMNELEIQ